MDSQTYKYPNIPEVKIVILLGEPQNICCDRAKKILTNKNSGIYRLMNKKKKEFINLYPNEGDLVMISYSLLFQGYITVTNLENKKSMKFSIPELNILYYYFGEFKIIDNGFTDLYN